jgi:hypothetical protein
LNLRQGLGRTRQDADLEVDWRRNDHRRYILRHGNTTDGGWKVYDGTTDTGAAITINGAANSATLNYTVSFAVRNAGTASGSTISATYDSTAITSGAVVPAGK